MHLWNKVDNISTFKCLIMSKPNHVIPEDSSNVQTREIRNFIHGNGTMDVVTCCYSIRGNSWRVREWGRKSAHVSYPTLFRTLFSTCELGGAWFWLQQKGVQNTQSKQIQTEQNKIRVFSASVFTSTETTWWPLPDQDPSLLQYNKIWFWNGQRRNRNPVCSLSALPGLSSLISVFWDKSHSI